MACRQNHAAHVNEAIMRIYIAGNIFEAATERRITYKAITDPAGDGGDGKRRYWIDAIQSAWIRSKRIIFGCPVPLFAQMVEDALQEFIESEELTEIAA